MDLCVTTRVEGDRAVVHVEGEIDVHTGPELREQLTGLVAAGHYHLIVDMEQVGFTDSSGLGVLIGALARLRPHHGSLRVVCTQERMLKIFRITGLSEVFPFDNSVAEAIARAAPRGHAAGEREPQAGTVDVLR